MSEILYIRLGSQAKDTVSWLIINTLEQDIIASGELSGAEQLSELTDKAVQRTVHVFVPGCDVALKRLVVPTKSKRAMHAAVPYMLEEEVAQDVDDLCFAYSHLPGDAQGHNCFVAMTERAQMLQWQSWLADADISAKTLIPETLAMPYQEEQWSAIALGLDKNNEQDSQVVTRLGQWQGYTLDKAAWQFMLQNTLLATTAQTDEDAEPQTVTAYSTLPAQETLEDSESVTLVKGEEELPLALFAQSVEQNTHHGFSLLQGEFKRKERRSQHVTNWLWVAGIAACALLLNVGYKSAQLWQLTAEQEKVEAQIETQYKKAFPSAKRVRIDTIKSQLNSRIAKLGGGSDKAGFLAMLSQVQPAFAKTPGLKPESLKFDGKRQELRLQAIADDYQQFERFKGALSTTNVTVKPGAQRNQGDQVTGSFSIVSKGGA